MAILNKGIITEFYNKYRADMKTAMKFENELQQAGDRKEWVRKLAEKSEFLRKTFRENEIALGEWVYPFVRGELQLDDDLANEFYTNAVDMVLQAENDTLMTNGVFKMLREYYRSSDNMEDWIKCTFMLGVTYDDQANEISEKRGLSCFEEIIRYSDFYFRFDDWDVRKRILQAYCNCINGKNIKTNEERLEYIVRYENAKRFFERNDIREFDGDRFDFDLSISEMKEDVIWAMLDSDSAPTKAILDYIHDNLLSSDIGWGNYLKKSSDEIICFLWYKYYNGDIDVNRYVEYMFLYYRCLDDEISYENSDLMTQKNYKAKTACMQECFRAVAMPLVTLENQEKLFDEMLSEYKEFYLNMPYLDNNNYLNRDLCETTKLMLRGTSDVNQGFQIIFDVVSPRNAATMIHSIMVGKIASEIVDCVIDDCPELFFNYVGIPSERIVRERRESIKRFMVQCATIHDIGKAFIYDVVGLQSRKLTAEEFGLIRKHPEFGAQMLEDTKFGSRYTDAILGHHKTFDGLGGYPEWFDNTQSEIKIIIDILSLSDCIDAATDMLGRNYEKNKSWQPALMDEIKSDEHCRYNQQIFYLVYKNQKICDNISYITNEGRMDVYYEIYKKYIANDRSDEIVRVVNVTIN